MHIPLTVLLLQVPLEVSVRKVVGWAIQVVWMREERPSSCLEIRGEDGGGKVSVGGQDNQHGRRDDRYKEHIERT